MSVCFSAHSIHPSGTCILSLPVVLRCQAARSFLAQLREVCRASVSRVVLDFSQTRFINSEGIGALTQAQNICQTAGVDIAYWSVSAELQPALVLAGFRSPIAPEEGTDAILADSGALAVSRAAAVRPHPSIHCRWKRLVDICGALVGLAILGLLLVPVALAIQIDSPGPIFFSQIRRGYLGRPFRLWKFRSMVTNASQLQHLVNNQAQGAFFKCDRDPRVTRVGGFLRKTSLDELPQFWNILKGEMSLVGTRPPTFQEVECYQTHEWRRLDVKPGLTGVWQVSGRSNIKDFSKVVALDKTYQRRWSLGYDLQIILKTIFVIFSKRSGAM
ncbi:MAG: sugar transferase [Cyanobacteria bacterium J06626_23]